MEAKHYENTYVVAEDGKFILKKEVIGPAIPAGHVLIQIAYSTCNPYDGLIYGPLKADGKRLGCEGSGTVIAIGDGVDAAQFLNKKVSFSGDGAWAHYIVLDAATSPIIVLEDCQDLAKAPAAFVNPLTAIGQLDLIKKKGSKSYVANAAASSLNKMLIQLGQKDNIESINIVRKAEQQELLKSKFGAKHVFLQDSATFEQDLKGSITELAPLVFFDVVGGGTPTTLQTFESLPAGSQMVFVACLTGASIPINPVHVLFTGKSISTFFVFPWVASLTAEDKQRYFKQVADDLGNNEGKIFGTNFTKELPLEQWEEALATYGDVASKDHGKILLKCNP